MLTEPAPIPFKESRTRLKNNNASPVKTEAKMSTKEELKKALSEIKKEYSPYLRNLAPELKSVSKRIEIKNFRRNGKDVTIPEYGAPLGYAFTEYKTEVELDGFDGKEVYLHFGAADYIATVYFNGECVGIHEGFFSPFEFNVTKAVKTGKNELRIVYGGVCDQTTIANMTNHSYFNLAGEGSGSAMDQYVTIHAEQYTPVGEGSIPLGENAAVEGTPMDFRKAHKIGDEIEADFEQLRITGGYDHNYVTDGYNKASIREIAEAWSEKTGIQMNVLTDCPCVQFYAANFVDQEHGKNGHVYNKREAFCLETQVEPNAVNVENFHSPILEAGERYYSETIYRFSVKK